MTAANQYEFRELERFLTRLPGMQKTFGCGPLEDGGWWVKFSLDISHHLSWRAVQELGHVLNYLSLEDRLPTVFMPVSPPPNLNGGPEEFLSWVIECRDITFTPSQAAEWLEDRLPKPVEDEHQWMEK